MSITKEVDRFYRDNFGKLVTSLVSYFRLSNLQLAEDIVQETFVAALKNWSAKGIPTDPQAWLFKVCKNKALNVLDRERTKNKASSVLVRLEDANHQLDQSFLPSEIKDNQLRLLFAACHPHFSAKARIILTLKILAGFKVEEIAKGLVMQPGAVRKTLLRTKQTITELNMPLKVPFILQSRERLNSVHQVLYLTFNEGYRASFGDQVIREELCLQGMQLVKALLEEENIMTQDTQALFSLMLFNVSRFHARLDDNGEPIELELQDRSLWDQDLILQGIKYFNAAKSASPWSNYHYEAAIASLHCTAPSFKETPWDSIVKLYDGLLQINASPFVCLNRNLALFYSGCRHDALRQVESIRGLENNYNYLAALAKMNHSLGNRQVALDHYLDAFNLATVNGEKRFLAKKIQQLRDGK